MNQELLYHPYYVSDPDSCLDIPQDVPKMVYYNFGDTFSIEFDIRVYELPSEVLSAFRFSATDGNGDAHGDNIPAVFVNQEGQIQIVTSLNDYPSYSTNFEYVEGRVHHVNINQLKKNDGYFYEIIIDGNSIVEEQNKKAKSYPTVNLYTRLSKIQGSLSHHHTIICHAHLVPFKKTFFPPL